MKGRFKILTIAILLVFILISCKKPLPVQDINNLGPLLEVLDYKGQYFEIEQFHVANNPKDNCKQAHYHAPIATSVCGVQETDPNPSACGFGKVSEVPARMIREYDIPYICAPDAFNLDISCKGGGNAAGTASLSDEDAKKYEKVEKSIVTLAQPQDTTCSPTSAAIDLLHWNSTIAPGIINVDSSALILDLAKKMNTSGAHGTKTEKIGLGLASYLSEHAPGKFNIRFIYLSKSTKIVVKGPKDTPVKFVPTDSIGVTALSLEMENKANIIVNYKKEDGGGHTMKLVALNTKAEGGKYKAAFANPQTGTIMQTTMDYDGNIEVDGQQWKLVSIVSVAPK